MDQDDHPINALELINATIIGLENSLKRYNRLFSHIPSRFFNRSTGYYPVSAFLEEAKQLIESQMEPFEVIALIQDIMLCRGDFKRYVIAAMFNTHYHILWELGPIVNINQLTPKQRQHFSGLFGKNTLAAALAKAVMSSHTKQQLASANGAYPLEEAVKNVIENKYNHYANHTDIHTSLLWKP